MQRRTFLRASRLFNIRTDHFTLHIQRILRDRVKISVYLKVLLINIWEPCAKHQFWAQNVLVALSRFVFQVFCNHVLYIH